MKRFSVVILLICCFLFVAGTALAVPRGMTLTWKGGGMGQVTFSGTVHAKAGLQCSACHPSIFLFMPAATGVKITMKEINAGKYCGACHNGSKAFSAQDPNNCAKCHKMPSS
ncbi:MAG: cytochrome c3 family protein [Nitrospiraceae bacterium]|nr:cytochrome c3 family protein [Nitrospiraceae bacterium]